MIVLHVLAIIESASDELSAVQLARKIDLLTAIRLIKESWSLVTPATLINCFRKAKFEINFEVLPEQTLSIFHKWLGF